MTRCDPLYEHMKKDKDFCKKFPCTISRIEKHIKVREDIKEKVARSEILKCSSEPFGNILSEGAARSLHSLKNEADYEKAIDLIIQKAEQKEMDNQSIAVTYKEVQQIVHSIVPPKTTKAAKGSFDKAKDNITSAFTKGEIPDNAISSTIAEIDELISMLQSHKSALIQRQATSNARASADNNTDLVGQREAHQPEEAEA
jgi:hypothetical protein